MPYLQERFNNRCSRISLISVTVIRRVSRRYEAVPGRVGYCVGARRGRGKFEAYVLVDKTVAGAWPDVISADRGR